MTLQSGTVSFQVKEPRAAVEPTSRLIRAVVVLSGIALLQGCAQHLAYHEDFESYAVGSPPGEFPPGPPDDDSNIVHSGALIPFSPHCGRNPIVAFDPLSIRFPNKVLVFATRDVAGECQTFLWANSVQIKADRGTRWIEFTARHSGDGEFWVSFGYTNNSVLTLVLKDGDMHWSPRPGSPLLGPRVGEYIDGDLIHFALSYFTDVTPTTGVERTWKLEVGNRSTEALSFSLTGEFDTTAPEFVYFPMDNDEGLRLRLRVTSQPDGTKVTIIDNITMSQISRDWIGPD